VTPYWSDVSGSIQNIWHPPRSVDTDTPEQSKVFIEDVLKGGDLL
jgi:multiple sugar transport system substrate-binding protein